METVLILFSLLQKALEKNKVSSSGLEQQLMMTSSRLAAAEKRLAAAEAAIAADLA